MREQIGEIDKFPIIVGKFNTLLLVIERSSKQKVINTDNFSELNKRQSSLLLIIS